MKVNKKLSKNKVQSLKIGGVTKQGNTQWAKYHLS